MHDTLPTTDDAAPKVGTLHYAEGAAATVPQNLGGLSRRRGHLTDRLVRGWRVLLGPSVDRPAGGHPGTQELPLPLREISAGETVTPVGTVAQPGEYLGVLRFQPVLYTHANLQEYRARRRRDEHLGRIALGVMALAVTLSVSVVLFVHPASKRSTTLGTESAPVAQPAAAVAPVQPARRIHTVVKGDTLGAIAARHSVKLNALLAANGLSQETRLRIGRKLVVPGTTVILAARPPAQDRAAAFAGQPLAGTAAERGTATAPERTIAGAGSRTAEESRQAGAAAPDRARPLVAGKRGYVVRKGDFPEIIARRMGISPETLLFHNRLTHESVLHPGQKLEVPPTDGYYRTVRRGETLGRILAAGDLEESRFRRFNPEVGDRVKAGQVVFIPGKAPAVPEARRERRRARGAADEGPRGYRGHDSRKRAHRGFFGDLGRAIANGFNWPISSRAISSGFGERGRSDWHPGIDIRAGVGTPIRAARDGVVVRAGWEGGYGRMVEIRHGGGVSTRYAHASTLAVRPGEHVAAGEVIGRVGTSGRSTGPHLHYEVRIDGRPVNPRRLH